MNQQEKNTTQDAPHTLVRAEQARQMLDRTRISNLVAFPASLLVAWLLWTVLPAAWLLAWLAARLTVCCTRIYLDRAARRANAAQLPLWHARYDLALLADGTLFGLLGSLLMPSAAPVVNAAMAAALVGITGVGLVVLSSSWRSCMAFTLPILLPGALYQLALAERVPVFLGLGMLIFLSLLVLEVRKSAAHTEAMLYVRFRMDELAQDRLRAMELAQRSDAAKGQFLATISHEMRTPLHGILGLARELRQPGLPVSTQTQHLQTLERAGDHLLGIINDVLDYSKIESGAVRLQEQAFDLHALLHSVHQFNTVAAQVRGLNLVLDSHLPTACWLHGDPVRLRQVLLNLLGNAIKFTDRGEVRLSAHATPGPDGGGLQLQLDVADTGPGVPEAERERIFNAFHQADGSYARRQGGTGLGLTISRELARAMGGDLQCVTPGRPGALFRLNLNLPLATGLEPAAATSSAQTSRADAEPMPPQPRTDVDVPGLRVLLAEDNAVNALVATAMLERARAVVTHAGDGEAAVARARERNWDLILMDCQMPGIDGFEATRRIRADERQRGLAAVRVVALTANALEGDRQRCLDAGMDDYLGKPFNAQDLQRVLGSVALAGPALTNHPAFAARAPVTPEERGPQERWQQ